MSIMNQIRATCILLMISGYFNLFGQLNPVNNLQYWQDYELGNNYCPAYNCFNLYWQPPDTSVDTLLGYHIYKSGQLYVYTSNTSVACTGYYPCDYDDFYENIPFWLTVKAVYNSDSIESIANDSVYVDDLMISVEEYDYHDTRILKNPLASGENISIEISPSSQDNCRIKIVSLHGWVIKNIEIENAPDRFIYIPTVGIGKGVYLISIETNERIITKKVIII
jgi:hypothetical protein